MPLQTQPNTEVFTIFGPYLFEKHGDCSPLNSGRSDSQDRCDTGDNGMDRRSSEAARSCQQHNRR